MTEAPSPLRFLTGYPEPLLAQVRQMLSAGQLGDYLAKRYLEPHTVRTDTALYEYVSAIKNRHLRNAPALAKVVFDNHLQIDQRALGTLTSVSRVQGGRLTAKREIRVAALFKDAPAAMLAMIIAHELSHLKEREHNKPFYALCEHLLAGYAQVEFDTRIYLVWRASQSAPAVAAGPASKGIAPSELAPKRPTRL